MIRATLKSAVNVIRDGVNKDPDQSEFVARLSACVGLAVLIGLAVSAIASLPVWLFGVPYTFGGIAFAVSMVVALWLVWFVR